MTTMKFRGLEVTTTFGHIGLRLLLVVACILVFGCATTKKPTAEVCAIEKCTSSVISKKINEGALNQGVIYSIPSNLLELTVSREKVTKESLEKALKTAKEKEKAAKDKVSEQEKVVIPDLTTMLNNSGVETPERAKLSLDLELAKLQLVVLKKKLSDLETATRNAQSQLDAHLVDNIRDTIELKATSAIPSNQKYVAQLRKGSFSTESLELKTTKAGLLSGGMGRSEGQLDEIFVGIVSAVASFAGPPTVAADIQTARGEFKFDDLCSAPEGKYSTITNPLSKELERDLNSWLSSKKLCYKLEQIDALSFSPPKLVACTNTSCPLNSSSNYANGLVYPRPVTLEFKLFDISSGTPAFVKSYFPEVSNHNSLGVISLDTALFANNEYEFEFSDGMLTRHKVVSPNEFTSFLALFPAAAKELVSIPAELLQLKIDYSSKEKGYYEAQLAALQARIALESALEASTASRSD